jgi:hypothetical protein
VLRKMLVYMLLDRSDFTVKVCRELP